MEDVNLIQVYLKQLCMCAKSPWYPITGMILALVLVSIGREKIGTQQQKRGGSTVGLDV